MEGDLTSPKPPSRTEIAVMEKRGCAVRRGNQHTKVELELNQNWTHDEVTQFLKDLLPLPFAYAEQHLKRTRRPNRDSVPLWVLLNKEKGKLDVVPSALPNGEDLYMFKGRSGASSAESHVYVGEYCSLTVRQETCQHTDAALRDRIPTAVCSAWDPDYVPDAVAKGDQGEEEEYITDNEGDQDWEDDGSTQSSVEKSIVEVPASKVKGKGCKFDDDDGMPNRSLTIISG